MYHVYNLLRMELRQLYTTIHRSSERDETGFGIRRWIN